MTKPDVLRFIFTRKSALAPWKRVHERVTLIVFIDAVSMLLEGRGVATGWTYTHTSPTYFIFT